MGKTECATEMKKLFEKLVHSDKIQILIHLHDLWKIEYRTVQYGREEWLFSPNIISIKGQSRLQSPQKNK